LYLSVHTDTLAMYPLYG